MPWEKTRREGWADFPFFSFLVFSPRWFPLNRMPVRNPLIRFGRLFADVPDKRYLGMFHLMSYWEEESPCLNKRL